MLLRSETDSRIVKLCKYWGIEWKPHYVTLVESAESKGFVILERADTVLWIVFVWGVGMIRPELMQTIAGLAIENRCTSVGAWAADLARVRLFGRLGFKLKGQSEQGYRIEKEV